ncbi:MAG: ABC transporter permease [Limnochordaceae bacterium]|nr:ABC transporter permease [Limnochordaceae bacterium]
MWVGLVLVGAISGAAMVGPYLTGSSPTDMSLDFLAPPSAAHPFGTDSFGRDVLARLWYGTRISLVVGLGTMVTTTVLGTAVGLLAGYYPRLDEWLMRTMDVFMAFPAMLLALGIMAALGRTSWNVLVALTIVYTPRTARVVRSVALSVRQLVFVDAARALGAPDRRVLVYHVLPNIVPAILVQATFIFGYAILAEAGLSFIGVGIQPPVASLGNILGEARVYLREAPWLTFLPGIWIVLLVLGINLMGDGLRDTLDPRIRHMV